MLPSDHKQHHSPLAHAMLIAMLLLISTVTGCSSTSTATPMAMMGASCAPGAQAAVAAPAPAVKPSLLKVQAGVATSTVIFDFAPAFTATCRPDHEFTHLDLALAFADASRNATYEMLPMFGATASPAARRYRSVTSPADFVDAR